jgi:hypothetical protein
MYIYIYIYELRCSRQFTEGTHTKRDACLCVWVLAGSNAEGLSFRRECCARETEVKSGDSVKGERGVGGAT